MNEKQTCVSPRETSKRKEENPLRGGTIKKITTDERGKKKEVVITDGVFGRFNKKINKNGPLPDQSISAYQGLSNCWQWTAAQSTCGYGKFALCRDAWTASRVAWMLFFDKSADGFSVCHMCDNPLCVNPDHLFLGTRKDNAQDRERKGRGNRPSGENHTSKLHPEKVKKGSNHPKAKLTENDILEIVNQRLSGRSITNISNQFNISRPSISQILWGWTWRHVPRTIIPPKKK